MEHRIPPLAPRLAALADAIVGGSRVADVGSDHGLLPLWLAATGRATYCLATEKTEELLRGVARPPASAPWAALLAYRSGDGLAALRPADRIDTVVLAGLGGRTIASLLDAPESGRPALARLVLQPRSEFARVRRWLSEHGWRLQAERLTAERGRLHLTLAAARGDDADLYRDASLSRDDLWTAGPLLARSRTPEHLRFWQKERDRLAAIVARSRTGPSFARAAAGLARAERILSAISPRGG
jgi:tRNA (adenine22-N1)-methyltransferase